MDMNLNDSNFVYICVCIFIFIFRVSCEIVMIFFQKKCILPLWSSLLGSSTGWVFSEVFSFLDRSIGIALKWRKKEKRKEKKKEENEGGYKSDKKLIFFLPEAVDFFNVSNALVNI